MRRPDPRIQPSHVTGAGDHGVSEALDLRDSDQNGVELYRDRAPEEWQRNAEGALAMFTRRLGLDDLLRQRGTSSFPTSLV